MIDFYFPDNTVLIYFTLMGRQDLLAQLLNGRGAWTITIEAECRRSSSVDGLAGLTAFFAELGDAIVPTPAERADTALLRNRLARPGDSARDHLGEAETMAVVNGRGLSAIFLTDDNRAAQLATSLNIPTATTLDVLRIAVRSGRLSTDAMLALGALLEERGRRLPRMPRTGAELHLWLEGRTSVTPSP